MSKQVSSAANLWDNLVAWAYYMHSLCTLNKHKGGVYQMLWGKLSAVSSREKWPLSAKWWGASYCPVYPWHGSEPPAPAGTQTVHVGSTWNWQVQRKSFFVAPNVALLLLLFFPWIPRLVLAVVQSSLQICCHATAAGGQQAVGGPWTQLSNCLK